ncbi:uncharacterized protein LOC127795385 [Diospyros lotus]|uniref:uncharacterized protein LOC127795385 n=1 Tax=Diospyros lotus TaxID=55363 RepID=UPI0022556620|nr:uncharacterized protein LOC127795385 [Diospyros lotus]
MAFSSSWILSLKFVLISAGVVSIAMMLKFSVPLIVGFAVNDLPVIWSALVSWLRPPYLYFIVNGIIITIAALSRFLHSKNESEQSDSSPDERTDVAVPVSAQPDFSEVESPAVYESEAGVSEVKNVVVNGLEAEVEEDEFVISRSTWTPPKRIRSPEVETETLFPMLEKPLASVSVAHRKPIKAGPDGCRALRVAKPKRHESMENTWKMIMESQNSPATARPLKKADQWENLGRELIPAPQNYQSPQRVKKSATFRDRTNYEQPSPASSSPGSGKMRKEPSLSQDELNRRVEAFIRKFNEEMRLQRQESLNQYVEMINRGAH